MAAPSALSAVTLAPAVGLPPELPGMAAADLVPRQIWWVATIAATAAGIYLIATQARPWALVLAVALIVAPHLIGAPVAPHGEGTVPAELVARFVANSIAANAVFWCFIGLLLGIMAIALARLNKEVLIDVADISIDEEIERVIEAKTGIRIKVASTMVDSNRCLLFVHVSPADMPSGVGFARVTEIGEQLKQHIASVMGKTIDQVYWQFPPEAELRPTAREMAGP